MRRSNAITKATRHATHTLLKNTPYCPDYEFVDGTLSRVSCTNSATATSIDIRLDGQSITAEDIAERIYHAAAHYACIQIGESSHNKAGRHTNVFKHALEAVEATPYESLTKTQKDAVDKLLAVVKNTHRAVEPRQKHAYNRTTLQCPDTSCKTTLTIRDTAASKVIVECVEHRRVMSAR